ncbi:MAG TPA: universal stress protein [Terriglobales bacterium]|jgi:nucleotide-binding universal stress UspA family protein|nr:universal stress protein [Terriglobales bacterium]
MKNLKKILVPTDLSDNSRRALAYAGALAEDEKASLLILNVANELNAWELHTEDLAFIGLGQKTWPLDRVLNEASLDLTRFLESSVASLKNIPMVTKRVVLGPIPQQIAKMAEDEHADLIILSPRRHRSLRHWLSGGITDRVTRLSPCPVLSVTGPLPTNSWRGKAVPWYFVWPRQTATAALEHAR